MKLAVVALTESSMYNENQDTIYFEKHITEWTEITNEEYKDLERAIRYLNQQQCQFSIVHKIIFFPQTENDTVSSNQKEFILEKVSDYKAYLEKEERKRNKEKAEEERKKLERKMKRELKTRDQKLKLLEELKKELEV